MRRHVQNRLLQGVLISLAAVNAAQAQWLMSDNFDLGNSAGSAPLGWSNVAPANTILRITTNAPASGPNSVEMIDNSASGRPEMYQDFRAASSGRALASLKSAAPATSPCSLQLLTTNGAFLCAVVLNSTGWMGYDTNGTTTIDTTVPWTTNTWQDVEVEWFDDHTFNAYLGGTQFAQRRPFAAAADPGRIKLVAGTTSGTGRTSYVDNVRAVVTQARLSDDFDAGNSFGSNPTNWVVTKPAGTTVRVVDSSVRAPASAPYCVEFSDDSPSGNPEIYTNFPATAEARIFFSALIPSTNQAPLAMHLRTTNGTYLTSVRLGENGRMEYNATAGGSGPFTTSAVSWTTNAWQTVRVDWFNNFTFSAYLGSNQFAANVPFGTNALPGRALFRLADVSRTNRLAYLDDVLVNRAIYPQPTRYAANGAWLAYAYLSSQPWVDRVPQVAFQMKTNYRVPYWFVNVGMINAAGTMSNPPPRIVAFMNKLKAWEDQNGYQFKVIAWMNGLTDTVDINDASVRSNIVGETKKFVSASVPGSFVAGAARTFDGIQLDLEPIGNNGSDTRFNNLKLLFDDIKTGFTALGISDKLTSLTPHKYGTTSEWWWPAQYYYEIGQKIDLICAMTYNSSNTTGAAYQTWIQDQTTNILKAVSGKSWNNDAQHPAPTNGVKVMIGFPAYANSTFHTNTAENTMFAGLGTEAGLADLRARGDFSTNYFQGAAVYLHADGTGSDGFASYDKDWWWFGQYWLNAWDLGPVPGAPTGLAATAGDGQVILAWAASPDATSYNVKRATVSGGPYTVIASNLTGLVFTNTGLSNGTTYYYVVSAGNANGESVNSAEASATPLTAFQQWQIQYFGSTGNPAAAPDADPDGDGQNNQSEFAAGTIPTNPTSVFKATILPLGDDFTITWPSVPGIPYIVEWTPVLTNGWQPLSTVTGAASPAVTTSFTDTSATGATQRFYRVHIP